MSYDFKGKIVLVTGSSMGIGKAVALDLALRGAKIVLNARNSDRLKATETEMQAQGFDVAAFAGDITLDHVAQELIDFTIRTYGSLDVLINNAGTSMRGAIETVSPDVVRSIYEVNTVAPLVLTKMSMPHIKASKGSIVFISSLAGLRGLPLISVYCSAKMALTALTDALRVEHQSDGIHIGIVYVGITEVEKGKNTIGAQGQLIPLDERKGIHVASTQHVAASIRKNITSRKKKTVVGLVGKAFNFMNRYFPFILEFATKRSYSKTKKLYS